MHTHLSKLFNTCVILLFCLSLQQCRPAEDVVIKEQGETITVNTANYIFTVEKEHFRYQFQRPDGTVVAPSHAVSGLQFGKSEAALSNARQTRMVKGGDASLELEVETEAGSKVIVNIHFDPHAVKMEVVPGERGAAYDFILRTGGLGPAYGMADHAAYGEGKDDLVLDNFVRDPLFRNNGSDRMISNFTIFPKQGFAEVNIEPDWKVVRITAGENAQGSRKVQQLSAFYYFLGNPKEIYQAFLNARNATGHPVYKPKPAWFGVGWEAFGALAWNTNSESVKANIDQYLDYGYPLQWMVVGSGFWPRGVGEFDEHGTPYNSQTRTEAAKKLEATTSFGMWDKELYPDPKGFIDYFHDKDLIFTIGLRIGFIPGGPFTDQGLENGYFLTDENGEAQLQQVGFPRVPVYLLNSRKPEAVDWYVDLCQKWLDYGVDGFKEDLFHWPKELPDDLIDPINRKLMEQGVFIMGRNNYLGSPADIHRYDDFNYNQDQDRGPINGLAYAYSGFPNVYPDIVGGTGLATGRFGEESRSKLQIYLIRYAQFAALNPSMAFGFGPWNFGEEVNQFCLQAAQRHDRLVPHIYSNAVRAAETGFPYPMTPLPLAYPDDPQVHEGVNTTDHRYEWLIGESLLAAPLFGDDYERARSRDIYLPPGKWMAYDTGTIYEGGQTLEDFSIPLSRAPLFVGGTGFVVERENGQLFGRLYPLNPQSETTFRHTDGVTKSEIRVKVKNWEDLQVTNATSGEEVAVEMVRHAYQFELVPGQNYTIR